MNYVADAREQVRRYEQRLQQTKQTILLYAEIFNDEWTLSQLKAQEISYTKSLKLAQESLARIEKSRRARIDEMTPEEKRTEYNKMCEERIDHVLMYGFDT
jgi:hypothetical protein